MDDLLLPYLQATDESERQRFLAELLMVRAAPVIRQSMRRKLGLYVDAQGSNPLNQDAEDLYQEIMTKVVQALHELADPHRQTDIEDFLRYVGRIASNACVDTLRSKSPARARLKNNLYFLLTHHRDFALWKLEGETLCGFADWRETSKSLSFVGAMTDIDERLSEFRSNRLGRKDAKQLRLTRLVAELFEWIGGPIVLEVLVGMVAKLTAVDDYPSESIDADSPAYLEALSKSTLTSTSRLEEQELLKRLWNILQRLPIEQRHVFCLGFEDNQGRDLFTVLLEAAAVTFAELTQGLEWSPQKTTELWSRMPMDDASMAVEIKTSRPQVQKYRFRALQRLRKELLQ